MTTKLYFHAESHGLSGTLPTGEQDAQAANFTATNANTLREMSRAIGLAMVNQQGTTVATVSNQAGFIGFWTPGPLSGAQTVGGASETLSLNFAAYESNLSANLNFRFHVYIWRPSTGAIVGDCCTYATVPSDTTAEPGAASSIRVATAIVDIAAVSALDGDVPIIEVWTNTTQAAATAYTVRMYYGGTIENATENAVVTDHASFVEFSQNLVFQSPDAQLSNQSSVFLYETTTVASALLANQSVLLLYIPRNQRPSKIFVCA